MTPLRQAAAWLWLAPASTVLVHGLVTDREVQGALILAPNLMPRTTDRHAGSETWPILTIVCGVCGGLALFAAPIDG